MPVQYAPGYVPLYSSVSFDNLNFGRCDYPRQLDSLGHRCGGRAASVRPGGRFANLSLGATASGFSGCFLSECIRPI